MSKYVDRVLAELKEKNAHEAEFLQTAEEVLDVQPVEDDSDLVEVVNPFEDEGGGI